MFSFLSKHALCFPVIDDVGDGIVAIGGDLSLDRLVLAYNSGIFPWYNSTDPIIWWSPDPRMVLFPEKFRASKSLRKTMRSGRFEVTRNKAFNEVIDNCASVKRTGQKGTWIIPEMRTAYKNLHKAGLAESFEVWQEEKLVGGLYGVNLKDKKVFCGESMFSLVSDASKVAFATLVGYTLAKNYKFIDCQVYTPHTQSLGAEEIPRKEFLKMLAT